MPSFFIYLAMALLYIYACANSTEHRGLLNFFGSLKSAVPNKNRIFEQSSIEWIK